MTYKQEYEGSSEWLDDISRLSESEEDLLSSDSETTSSSDQSEEETKEENLYGFYGLDDPYRYLKEKVYLYRVLREDESIEHGIFCQDKDSNRTVEKHIASGSRYPSKFISTTSSLDVARNWAYFDMKTREARDVPLRVVEIDIQVLAGTQYEKKCINLCNKEVRKHFIKGNTHKCWAKSSEEVLFVEKIPKFVTSADEVNTSTHYAQATSFQQPSLPSPLMTTPTTFVFTNELRRTLVYWLIDAFRPNTPPPKKENKRKGKDSDLVHMMSSMNL